MPDLMTTFTFIAAEPIARAVLEQVAKSRYVRFDELLKMTQPKIDRAAVKDALSKLKDMHLVDEKSTSIEDFNTFFITADGLEASRLVKQ